MLVMQCQMKQASVIISSAIGEVGGRVSVVIIEELGGGGEDAFGLGRFAISAKTCKVGVNEVHSRNQCGLVWKGEGAVINMGIEKSHRRCEICRVVHAYIQGVCPCTQPIIRLDFQRLGSC